MVEAVAMAGKIIGGIGGYEAGKFNRGVAQTEAIEATQDGVAEEARIREAARMAIGQQMAAQASNGFQAGTGSALDALTQSQVNATLDALTVRRQTASRARAKRIEGDIAYATGSNAMVQGMLGAAETGIDWASSKRSANAGRS